MSGSVPGGGPKAEPNLTPILDMVFQLITFFMLVINFKAAELDLTLQLPVLSSAKPLPEKSQLKMVVLNVQICTKCPVNGCEGYATLVREMDSTGKKVVGYHLACENGHTTNWPQGAITNGKTCLSVYRRLLCKEARKDTPSIEDYLRQEAEISMMAANPPLTRDDVVKGDKELADYVVIRADATCRYGAVDYIITKCQEQGFRKFALKTVHDTSK
jgi:biopolymer transport protein ExbD